jgi:hypothetical protein
VEKMIGFGYHLRRNQLDFIAEQGENIDYQSIYTKLDYYLQNDIKGPTSRKKVATILIRVWHLVPDEYQNIRAKALELYSRLSSSERLGLHWGMLLLTHPFFRDMTNELGNLFMLQSEIPSCQMYRKMRNLYGDKERVNVATKSLLATLRFLECLGNIKKSVYIPPEKKEIDNRELKNWLAEVVIRVSGKEALPVDLITAAPFIYPFRFRLNTTEIDSPSLSLLRQGLDMNMVCLR